MAHKRGNKEGYLDTGERVTGKKGNSGHGNVSMEI